MKIDEIMKDFNKKFKEGKEEEDLVHYGVSQYDYARIPFTSPRLNYMTFGGLPKGKLIEFSGENHSGKTTTALDIVANYQIMEDSKRVLWIDCENTLDVVWAKKLGVNVEDLIIMSPTNQGAETIFQFALDMIDSGEIGLVILDSLGVMVSNQAMEKSV
jgi:recombination protein RecA